jgi:phage tail-like protein
MTLTLPIDGDSRAPLGNFAFHVSFETGGRAVPAEPFGSFAEISGLEASMEHKVIKEGGRNYGPAIRVGPVSFGTVMLKRGIVEVDNLWQWWALFTGADDQSNPYPVAKNRCDVLIALIGLAAPSPADESHFADSAATPFGKATVQVDAFSTFGGKPSAPTRQVRAIWRLRRAMPVKFRAGDLNSKGSDIAVEELHLIHEGLSMEKPQ